MLLKCCSEFDSSKCLKEYSPIDRLLLLPLETCSRICPAISSKGIRAPCVNVTSKLATSLIRSRLNDTLSEVITLPQYCTSCIPKWHFFGLSLRFFSQILVKTQRRRVIRPSSLSAHTKKSSMKSHDLVDKIRGNLYTHGPSKGCWDGFGPY
jgi:hypothetical protein